LFVVARGIALAQIQGNTKCCGGFLGMVWQVEKVHGVAE